MSLNVVITDCSWGNIEVEKEYLPENAVVEGYQLITEDEVIEACSDADAILSEYAPITAKALKALKKCKIISNSAIGFDNIDVKAAEELGIAVANVPGYCAHEVADHAMSLILAASRNIVVYDKAVRKGEWNYEIGLEMDRLKGQVLGLAGFGKIAQFVAKRAQGFGFKVIANDPFIKQEYADSLNVKLVEIDKLLAESDIISCHIPAIKDTIGYFNKEKFDKMAKCPIFINTSRGRLVNEEDLADALENKKIRAAALDVLIEEPPTMNNRLFTFDNVIITPHAGFFSKTALREVRSRSAMNVTNFFQKEFNKINFVNKIRG
ncbi:MAG TPA: C-terminal binding protein [Bacillota bacterium]|nr:C-terminal binding protein [Bacillota bacterium]HPX68561.1 C-terminal binding protein [Bacillota bacterium]HQA66470.1 C-terminal binding protein [Bacillota bacterium]